MINWWKLLLWLNDENWKMKDEGLIFKKAGLWWSIKCKFIGKRIERKLWNQLFSPPLFLLCLGTPKRCLAILIVFPALISSHTKDFVIVILSVWHIIVQQTIVIWGMPWHMPLTCSSLNIFQGEYITANNTI